VVAFKFQSFGRGLDEESPGVGPQKTRRTQRKNHHQSASLQGVTIASLAHCFSVAFITSRSSCSSWLLSGSNRVAWCWTKKALGFRAGAINRLLTKDQAFGQFAERQDQLLWITCPHLADIEHRYCEMPMAVAVA
jgi:hypothetical protein